MLALARHWLFLAALTGIAAPEIAIGARAQGLQTLTGANTSAQPVSGAPVPDTAGSSPAANAALERPAAYVLPPADQCLVAVSAALDPLLDRPCAPLPGIFLNAEATIVGPHLTNQLLGVLSINGTRTDIIDFQGNTLNWSVMPRFELGYRLPDGPGALQLGYRFLATEGTNLFTAAEGALGDAGQKGRFDMNLVDLDYVSREFSLGPNWEMRWTAGARMAFIYFDSKLSFQNVAPNPGDVLVQLETNHSQLYGFHGLLDLSRKTCVPGLAILGRLDGSGLFGRMSETFAEQLSPTADGSVPVYAATSFSRTLGSFGIAVDVGLSYTVPCWNNSRLLIGYHYETIWEIARVGETGARAQVNIQGLLLRGEFNF
jgi:hypothetical protein